MSHSLSLMIPASLGYDANRMCATFGGPCHFSVLCYGTSGLMIGLHSTEVPDNYTSPAVPVDGWEAHGLTAERVAQITSAMVFSEQPLGALPEGSFVDLAELQGVTWGARLPKLPDPGSMATVTKDEFYRTAQPGFAVVKIVQTHVLNNPAHDDLRLLLALYEAQRDPFNPEPWVQSQGSAGVYPTHNLIGGPQLATHNDKLWRNDFEGNSYEPGVYGWVGVTE